MADIGALMVVTFGKWLAPMLLAAHTANHTQWEQPKKVDREEEEEDQNQINPKPRENY